MRTDTSEVNKRASFRQHCAVNNSGKEKMIGGAHYRWLRMIGPTARFMMLENIGEKTNKTGRENNREIYQEKIKIDGKCSSYG